MGNYYFLGPSLPPLALGEWPDLTFDELIARLEINLSQEDLEKTRAVRSYIDFLNVRARLLDQPFDPRGNLSEKELDEAMLTETGFPEYFFAFLKRYETPADRMANLSSLLASFFEEKIAKHTGLLKRYFTFEREWRLVLVALRAKQAGRDVAKELAHEDPNDPLVAQILSQKDSPTYEPPKEYSDLKDKFLSCGQDPWEQYKTFAEWRFKRLILLPEEPLFSVGWIIIYVVQHMIVEDIHRLQLEKGEEILRSLVEETLDSALLANEG